MSIYGTYLNQNSGSVALANTPLCNYETFIESAIDCNYFFESILDRADLLTVVNEAEGDKPKFDIKESIDKMIEKIQEMFNNFVGWVKKVMIEFKQKTKAWYEEHNIHKGLLKVALAGFSYDDIEAAQEKLENIEKYREQNNVTNGIMFKNKSYPCGINQIAENSLSSQNQHCSISSLFGKEIDEYNERIEKLKSMPAGDAKDEYEKLDKNISELKKRIDDTKNKDMAQQYDKYQELIKIKEKYNGYDSSYFNECLSQIAGIAYAQDSVDKYFEWKKGQLISKSEFDDLVKFVEDTVKRSNKIKDDEYWINQCKKCVTSSKEDLKCAKKEISNEFDIGHKVDEDYESETIKPEVKIDFRGAGYLYSAKLQVKMASLELNIATIALKNTLTINKRLTKCAFSYLLGYRALCATINKGYINPDDPNTLTFKSKQRKENLNKINSLN